MKLLLIAIAFLIVDAALAQEISYSISCPPGADMGNDNLPDSIDTSHYYSRREIRYVAEPLDGWSAFYDKMKLLQYPQKAKDEKLQSRITVGFQVNEQGIPDSVYIRYVDIGREWKKCDVCEELIIDYFRNTTWKAGTLRGLPLKTLNKSYVEFSIYDPKAKKVTGPFR